DARGNDALDLVRGDVHLTDPVRFQVGRRQRFAVNAWPGDWRTAEGDIQRLPIGTHFDTARTLADRNGGDDRLRHGIDDRQIPGGFIGHVHANAWIRVS